MLFVGLPKAGQQAVKKSREGMQSVARRGTLASAAPFTNFATGQEITLARFLEKMEADGCINRYVKQEQGGHPPRSCPPREVFLTASAALDKNPGAMFVWT